MHYQTLPPHQLLKPFVKYFWVLESDVLPAADGMEKILPDGCLELLFNFGDPVFRVHDDQLKEQQPRTFIHGQIRNYIHIQSTGKTGIIGARFYPTGLARFVKLPVAELTNKAISIEDIFGAAARLLEEQLMNTATVAARIRLIEEFLLRRLLNDQAIDHALERYIHLIVHARGLVALQDVSKTVRISERHLERKFSSLVGLSPKSFQRVVRLQHVLRIIQQKKFTSLAQLSFECGYYDQAHFTRDFREFTGTNPGKYIVSENIISDLFSTDNLFQDAGPF